MGLFSKLFGGGGGAAGPSGEQAKTFRPKKKFDKGTKRYDLYKQAKSTLGVRSLNEAVRLPEDEALPDWLCAHACDFYNTVSLMYGSISSHCTADSCPVMNAGPQYEYLSTYKSKTPVPCPASEYIADTMDWIGQQLDSPELAPPDGVSYDKGYINTVKTIFKRLFRVYAHIYFSHFDRVRSLGEEAHLNTCFKHFTYFVAEFKLIEKSELRPLEQLIAKLCPEVSL